MVPFYYSSIHILNPHKNQPQNSSWTFYFFMLLLLCIMMSLNILKYTFSMIYSRTSDLTNRI